MANRYMKTCGALPITRGMQHSHSELCPLQVRGGRDVRQCQLGQLLCKVHKFFKNTKKKTTLCLAGAVLDILLGK